MLSSIVQFLTHGISITVFCHTSLRLVIKYDYKQSSLHSSNVWTMVDLKKLIIDDVNPSRSTMRSKNDSLRGALKSSDWKTEKRLDTFVNAYEYALTNK